MTRSDSGETGSEMHPNRIIAAGWSAAQGGPGFPTANISLTQLRSDVPYDVQPVEIYSSTQYDVYCWAKAKRGKFGVLVKEFVVGVNGCDDFG